MKNPMHVAHSTRGDSDEGFRRLYARELASAVNKIKKERRHCFVFAAGIVGAILSPIFLLFAASFVQSYPGVTWKARVFMSLLCIVAAVFAVRWAYSMFETRLAALFKKTVVVPIARYAAPDMTYAPVFWVPERVFRESMLFTDDFNSYKGDDRFSGSVKGVAAEFSDIFAEKIVKNPQGETLARIPIFRGLFFAADFNKRIHGFVIIVPDVAEANLGWVGKGLQEWNFTRPGELVHLEDARFEKLFAVYASDQVEARYVLSPALMQRLADMREKHGINLYVSCVGDKIHIAFDTRKRHFEMPGPLLDFGYEYAREIYLDIRMCLDVIDDLKLDTRLWDASDQANTDCTSHM